MKKSLLEVSKENENSNGIDAVMCRFCLHYDTHTHYKNYGMCTSIEFNKRIYMKTMHIDDFGCRFFRKQ